MKQKSAGLAAIEPAYTVKYVVTKRFKYGDGFLEPGQEFRPAGGRFDEQIIAQQKLVERVESAVPSTRASRQRVRKEKG